MGGSKTNTTTSSGSTEPWKASQPYLTKNMKLASNMVNAGVGSGVYSGQTVTPWSKQTSAGMTGTMQTAQQNAGGKGISGQYQDILNQGGFTDGQQDAMGVYGQGASGGMNVGFGNQLGIGNQAMGQSFAEQNLQDIASGSQMGRNNADFERALEAATNRTQDAVDLSTSGAGRYGSGAHSGLMADRIGDLQARERSGQYERDRAAMFNANNALDSARMSRLGMGLNAFNAASGIQGQNYGRQLGAAGDMFNAGQQGISNMGTAYQGQMQPYQDMMGVGSMYEDLQTRTNQADLNRYTELQNRPWEQLARANAIYSGAGGMGGSSTQTTEAPGQNPFATGLGYASTGVGLLGGLQDLNFF